MRLTVEGTDEIIVSNCGLAVARALMKSLKIGAGLKSKFLAKNGFVE